MSNKIRVLRASAMASVAIVAGLPQHVQAQVATAPTTDTTAAATAEQSAPGLGDIVVTAQRRSENLQRAAIPVSAVAGDALVSAGISDVNNLSKMIPSLVVAQSPGSSINFYIRGVGTFAANILRENPVAFNFNGVYIGSPSAPVGTLYDLERLEVLKGPQGTLYGRNATGGSLNVIPRRPNFERLGGEGTVEYGNYNAKKVALAVNIPISDTLAFRLTGQASDRDGYLSDGTDDERGGALRASLLFKPTSSFSAVLVADYFKAGGKGAGAVLQPGALTPTAPDPSLRIGASDPRSTDELNLRFANVRAGTVTVPKADSYNRGEFWGVSATIEGDVGFGTLTVIPAYRKSRPNFLSYTLGYPFRVSEDDDQISFEARLASSNEHPFRYVVGAYIFTENKFGTNSIDQGPISRSTYTAKQNTESYAAFGQATYALTDSFRIVGGARQTHETKTQNTQLTVRTLANPTAGPSQILGNLSFNSTTYKAGVEFDAAPRSLLYASISTGFKSGGFFLGITDNSYRPESLTAYTVGSKNRFLDNKLQLNIEAFYWKYRDQQINYVGPIQIAPGVYNAGGRTTNAGNARMYGADAEIRLQATPRDLFAIDLQYLNSKYDSLSYLQFSGNGAPPRINCTITPDASLPVAAPAKLFSVNCAGKVAINAPEWSANLSYQHRFELGNDYALIGFARTRIESGRFLSIEYLPEEYQGAYRSSDLLLTLEGPANKWSISSYVNNVEDRTIKSGSGGLRPFINAAYTSLRAPRTYGVRASFKF